VSLTPAADNLLEHGRRIFRLEEAETAAKTVRNPYCGKLSFGCAATTVLYDLPDMLMEYTQKYPDVELKITGGTIQEVGTQMWSGALDLALVVLPLSSPAIERIVLFEETLWASCRRGMHWRKRKIFTSLILPMSALSCIARGKIHAS
jgi:LysR family hydrogen peroxide-inducible transcriptional activator